MRRCLGVGGVSTTPVSTRREVLGAVYGGRCGMALISLSSGLGGGAIILVWNVSGGFNKILETCGTLDTCTFET